MKIIKSYALENLKTFFLTSGGRVKRLYQRPAKKMGQKYDISFNLAGLV